MADLLYVQPQFQASLKGDQIEISKMAWALGMDRVTNIQKLKSYQQAVDRLAIWKKNSPMLVGLIEEALVEMSKTNDWAYTPMKLKIPDRNYVPELQSVYSRGDNEAIVVFLPTLGALMSANIFNKLDLQSQQGVWIKEALRRLQIFHQGNMPEAFLAHAVGSIVLLEPSENNSLDQPSGFGNLAYKFDLIGATSPAFKACQLYNSFLFEVDLLISDVDFTSDGKVTNSVQMIRDQNDLIRKEICSTGRLETGYVNNSVGALDNPITLTAQVGVLLALAKRSCTLKSTGQGTNRCKEIRKLSKEVSASMSTYFYEDSLNRINQNTLKLQNLSREVSMSFDSIPENLIREYINGDRSVFPWNKRKEVDEKIEATRLEIAQYVKKDFGVEQKK